MVKVMKRAIEFAETKFKRKIGAETEWKKELIEALKAEAEPLVVTKGLGEWLARENLGNEGCLFSIIGRLEDMWADSHFEEFITDNKKTINRSYSRKSTLRGWERKTLLCVEWPWSNITSDYRWSSVPIEWLCYTR